MIEEILKLKKEKNAVILAHNYQIPEIQDIADYIGDSLGLAREAAKTDADMIVFCGVHFMAETASITCPDKKVILPDSEAGCSLADSIKYEELVEWKKENPNAVVVSYVNTTALTKSLSDYCVTSSNAVKIIQQIPEDKEILFLPDRFLGAYVTAVTGRKMKIWQGGCHVHEKIGDIELSDVGKKYPKAELLVHPECGCSSSCLLKSAVYNGCNDAKVYSTEGMLTHVENSENDEFVIATEEGIIHRLKKENPGKKFYPVSEDSVCEYMKLINLEKLLKALKEETHEIKVEKELANKARIPIDRMLELS
jgi:quinolinate synthase